MLHPDQQLEA